jgi:RND family efflux transporter MFP subunit
VSRVLRVRFVVGAVAVLVLAAAGVYFMSGRGAAAVQYRTAAATMGTVTQTLPISGNLTPASETALDFGAAGRVQAVKVQAGQAVKPGDVLASLDASSLQAALSQAQANLGSAQAKLASDHTASPTSLTSAQAQVSSASIGLQNARVSLADTQAANQQAVNQAFDNVTNAQNKQQRDSSQRDSDCNANPSSQQCQQDKATVGQDADAVRSAQDNYSAALVKAQSSNDQAAGQVNTAQVQLQNAQASLNALLAGATSQQIQIDQAQVQVAQVNVDTAQRNVNLATLTAPVDGVVGAVNLVVGQTVSGGTSSSTGAAATTTTTHQVTIDTPGAFAVTGSVSDAQVGQVVVGQTARVIPAGATQALTGKVSQVAAAATVTSGVATFAVTVTLTDPNPALHAGTSAAVNIIINQVSQVLTIPTSAVRTTGAGSTVQVMVNGVVQSRPITLGASDALRTEVLQGLSAGDQVVVATVSKTVPTTGGNNVLGGAGGGRRGGGGGGFAAPGG